MSAKRCFFLTAAALGAGLGAILWAPPSSWGAAKGKVFDDWAIECEGEGAGQHCFASQVHAPKGVASTRILKISIGYLGPKGEPAAVLFAPLGISVAAGIGFRIGDRPEQVLPIQQCRQEGCIASGALDAAAIAELTRTGKAVVGFLPFGSDKPVAVPLSMKGFAAAYRSLN